MSVRMGRFGPFVQIGTKDDADKPRFAGLRPGQKMDTITPEQALVLFDLPRTLGTTAAGEPILANVGRFGPYIKYGPKYVSLKDDPYTVTLERALECIRIKQEADANRIIQDFAADGIQVLNGRYGPYITNREKNARAPKDRDPKSLTLEECRALIEAAPNRPLRGRGRFGNAKTKAAAKGKAQAADKGKAQAADKGRAQAADNGSGTDAGAARPRRPARAAARVRAVPAAPVALSALAAKSTTPHKVLRGAGARAKKAKRKPAARLSKPLTHAKRGAKSSAKALVKAGSSKKAAGAA
jgi:DNA topoisomerase-1